MSEFFLKFKNRIVYLYCDLLNLMHRPLYELYSSDPYHKVFQEFKSRGLSMDYPSVLEIGSRNVTGVVLKEVFSNKKDYTGFDILEGENVDVIGDVHEISKLLPSQKFDLVFSVSVFEHLLMPWKAVIELNKVMKLNGLLFISTHPSWPEHEMPWDYWRFQKNSFYALFNQYTGFEIIELQDGLHCKPYALTSDPSAKNFYRHKVATVVGVLVKKIAEYDENLLKWDIQTSNIVADSYPEKQS